MTTYAAVRLFMEFFNSITILQTVYWISCISPFRINDVKVNLMCIGLCIILITEE